MGADAILTPVTDRTGAITTINIIDPGEDYVSTPNVYLKVADVAVSNVSPLDFPVSGDVLYQGSSLSVATYKANVASVFKIQTASPANTAADIYQLRTYEYTGNYDPVLSIKIDHEISNVSSLLVLNPQNFPNYTDPTGNPTSIIRYGDGNAKANASFLDGLIVGAGTYLNDDGHLSSLGLVLESLDYNNFTYVLSVEKALKTYKDLVLNLLHPSGMRLRGRNLLISSNGFSMSTESSFQEGYDMDTFAGPSARARIEANTQTNQISTNIIRFVNTIAANIAQTVFANDTIEFTATNNLRAYSTITNVDWANTQVTIQDNVFVVFANVATGSVNASSNVINIQTVTGQYDGNFTNRTPANNIIFVGDKVSLNGGPYYTVTQVFANGNFSVDVSVIPSVNTAAVTTGILQAAVTQQPGRTLFGLTTVGGRPLGDINNTGTVTSADTLAYFKWAEGTNANTEQVVWITETLNPYVLANPVTYSNYINFNLTEGIENTRITVNKTANTDTCIVYGVVGQYEYPELLTENSYILITESSFTILAG
jgi:hypothetical protein